MLKDYVKRFSEDFGRFTSDDQLGVALLETGKVVLQAMEKGKKCDSPFAEIGVYLLVYDRAEISVGQYIQRLIRKAENSVKKHPK